MENRLEGPQDIQDRTTLWPSNCTCEDLCEANKNTNSSSALSRGSGCGREPAHCWALLWQQQSPRNGPGVPTGATSKTGSWQKNKWIQVLYYNKRNLAKETTLAACWSWDHRQRSCFSPASHLDVSFSCSRLLSVLQLYYQSLKICWSLWDSVIYHTIKMKLFFHTHLISQNINW